MVFHVLTKAFSFLVKLFSSVICLGPLSVHHSERMFQNVLFKWARILPAMMFIEQFGDFHPGGVVTFMERHNPGEGVWPGGCAWL